MSPSRRPRKNKVTPKFLITYANVYKSIMNYHTHRLKALIEKGWSIRSVFLYQDLSLEM